VAYHFVNACADRIGIVVVPQTRGCMTVIQSVRVSHFIELLCRRSGDHVRSQEVDEFRVESSSGAQAVAFFF